MSEINNELLSALEELVKEYDFLENQYNQHELADGWDSIDPSEAIIKAREFIKKLKEK